MGFYGKFYGISQNFMEFGVWGQANGSINQTNLIFLKIVTSFFMVSPHFFIRQFYLPSYPVANKKIDEQTIARLQLFY